MSPIQKILEAFSSNPRVTSLGPPSANDLELAEQALKLGLPEPLRSWISNFGIIDIERRVKGRPHLLLLGVSPGSSIDDDIVAFNRDSPTRPSDYLVFAHEFDGAIDHIYALDPGGTVFRNSGFLFPSSEYTAEYANSKWEYAFSNLEAFWDSKIEFYLEQ